MGKIDNIDESIKLPKEIIDAASSGNLVFFVGAGASKDLQLPSWSELADKAFEDLQEKEYLNFSDINQLNGLDPKQKLSIAFLTAKQKNYKIDIAKHLESKNEGKGKSGGGSIYEAISKIGCCCVTTNYDELLTPHFLDKKDGSTTPASQRRVYKKEEFLPNLLNEPGTVIHLHGAISEPDTMVVTTKQYLEHYDDKGVQEFLEELFEKKIVLFIGYGLEETEILEHILRRGSSKKQAQDNIRRYFALQGFFLSQKTLYENLHAYYEESFGVHLLGFTRDYKDYECLKGIIESWAPKINVRKVELVDDYNFINEVLNNE